MRKDFISIILFSIVTAVLVYLALNSTDKIENEVVFALVGEAKKDDSMPDVALYSYPSDCGINVDKLDGIDANLAKSFMLANEFTRGPIRLGKLEGFFNILSWADNVQLYEAKKMSLKFRQSNKRLVQVSRVGFSSSGQQAIVCLKSSVSGTIFVLEKNSGAWTLSKRLNVWVS